MAEGVVLKRPGRAQYHDDTMQRSDRPRVFLSYAREDIEAARTLRKALEALSVDVWFDETSILPGQRWRREISKAFRESEFFAILLSQNSVTKRGVVQREIREAIEVAKELPEDAIFLIPVRLEDVKPAEGVLSDVQWVDLFPDWAEGIRRISLAVYSRSSSTIEATRIIGAAAILEMIARAAAHLGANIAYRLPPGFDRATVIASEMALFSALVELIANSVTHGERDATGRLPVEVTLQVSGGDLKLDVTNNVPGRSRRLRYVPSGDKSGLGLRLIHAAIVQVGGTLEFTLTQKDNTHARFVATVTLPRADRGAH